MKKQYVSLLAVILSVSGFLFSCGDKMNKNTGNLKFDSIRVNETAHLFGDTSKPACNLVISFTYPVKSSDAMLKDSLNTYFLSACFGDKYMGMTPEEAVKDYTQTYINDYRRDLEPMYTEDEKNKENGGSIGAWYSYYKTIKSNVQFYEKNLLVYHIYYDEFTGGAHGIYSNTFLNMDLNTMRPLRLSDLFVEEYQEPLTDLIWNQLMAANKVTTHEELEDLGYGSTGEIAPTENFFLNKEGITFYYNVYDITPYAMGPVEVHIPFDMMAHLVGSSPIIGELKN
ncbi:RsiV family protein [Bacteroides sp.]|uniref:RsiV family protein n=1 Tax=Bacteroides sp. TaxID=29523 RepID=UPI002FC700F8